jgi:hypothetical protein
LPGACRRRRADRKKRVIASKGGASEPLDMLLPGRAGGAAAVRRTLVNTICRIADPTLVARPRQLHDASTVMRFQPAYQSMINRRLNDRVSCPARKSPKRALAHKPRIYSPASGKGGHESVQIHSEDSLGKSRPRLTSKFLPHRRRPVPMPHMGPGLPPGRREPAHPGEWTV